MSRPFLSVTDYDSPDLSLTENTLDTKKKKKRNSYLWPYLHVTFNIKTRFTAHTLLKIYFTRG